MSVQKAMFEVKATSKILTSSGLLKAARKALAGTSVDHVKFVVKKQKEAPVVTV